MRGGGRRREPRKDRRSYFAATVLKETRMRSRTTKPRGEETLRTRKDRRKAKEEEKAQRKDRRKAMEEEQRTTGGAVRRQANIHRSKGIDAGMPRKDRRKDRRKEEEQRMTGGAGRRQVNIH